MIWYAVNASDPDDMGDLLVVCTGDTKREVLARLAGHFGDPRPTTARVAPGVYAYESPVTGDGVFTYWIARSVDLSAMEPTP